MVYLCIDMTIFLCSCWKYGSLSAPSLGLSKMLLFPCVGSASASWAACGCKCQGRFFIPVRHWWLYISINLQIKNTILIHIQHITFHLGVGAEPCTECVNYANLFLCHYFVFQEVSETQLQAQKVYSTQVYFHEIKGVSVSMDAICVQVWPIIHL